MSSSQDNEQNPLKTINGLNIVETRNGLNHDEIHTYKPSRTNFNPKDYMVTESLSLIKIVSENGPSTSNQSSGNLSKDLPIEKKTSCTDIKAILDNPPSSSVNNEDTIVKPVNECSQFKEVGVQNNLGDDLLVLNNQPPPPYPVDANRRPQQSNPQRSQQLVPQNYPNYQYQYGPSGAIPNSGGPAMLPGYTQYPLRNSPNDQYHQGYGQSWSHYQSEEFFLDESVLFSDPKIRKKFIKKVYLLLAFLLLITTVIVAPFVLVEQVKLWAVKHAYIAYFAIFSYIILSIGMSCYPDITRVHPVNLCLLIYIAISLAIWLGFFSAFIDSFVFLFSLGITAIICISISLIAIFSSFDITKYYLVLFFAMLAMPFVFLIYIIASFFVAISFMHVVFSAILLILLMAYLMMETQLIMGGRRLSLSPEDYVLAVMMIYVDMIMIFFIIMDLMTAYCRYS